MRLLLVEDDVMVASGIKLGLTDAGYAVDWVGSGERAEEVLRTESFDAAIIDIGLPAMDGLELTRRLRRPDMASPALPVLILTARDALHDRVQGLDLGADDYLVKPFDLEELSARVRAALRRGSAQQTPELRHGEVALDAVAKRVTQGGAVVALTAREFALLQALMRHPDHILNRAQLEEALYGWGEEVESNAIEAHIYNLRKKLGARFIVTVRNQGYRLAPA